MEVFSSSTQQTKDLATRIATTLSPGDVIALYGDLGSGKTTFTRYLTQALNIEARVQSPTFVLIRHYENKHNALIKSVNHIDLYRLTTPEQIEDLGISELFSLPNSITIIEWPDRLGDLLPNSVKKIKFETIDEDKRKIYVEDYS